MQGIELYDVTDDGELKQVAITGPIKDMLTSEMVVLLVDEPKKIIYLWKGANAKVRRKFIGARVSQDLRGQKGLNFKVDSIDHGDEPQGFIQLVGGSIPMESAPDMAAMAPAGPTIPPQPPTSPQIVTSPTTSAPAAPPLIQPQVTVGPPAPAIGGQVQIPPGIEAGVQAIILELEKMPPPAPYHREIVFIGPYAFSIVETKKAGFGAAQVERRWELASPPEGQFLAQDYIPRAIIRSGKVLAVELLKGGTVGSSVDAQIPIFKIKYQK
ncbi:MAG: hypothetical protein ACTSQI_01635 [Candidatus Helarchaeota archaeon]